MNAAIQLLIGAVSSLLRVRGQGDISGILDQGLAFWRRGVSGRAGILALNEQIKAMVAEGRDPTADERVAQDEAIEAAEAAVLAAEPE